MPFNQDGGGELSAAQLNFFNNFVIESVDHKGRTSMRQIVTQDNNGRASVIQNCLSGTTSELRPSHG